jgi:antitoxin component YwqK of YwqJK toxin-antitoxin module
MKYFLSTGLTLFVSFLFAQTRVDTIHCGNIVGYGKMQKGKKEGLWKYENKSHTVAFTGNYHEGLKEGEWTCLNTKEKRIVHYKNNLLDGPLLVYKRESLYCEGTYRNGLKEGEWKYYNIWPNQIGALEYYENGLPVGEWQICSGYYDCYVGMMNAYGKNGYWVQTYPGQAEDPNNPGTFIIVEKIGDSILYVNGKESGFHNLNHRAGSREAGNYVDGKKEGTWTFRYDYYYEVVEYKNGLREGYDSIWSNNNSNRLLQVIFYLHDTINGPQVEFQDAGLLSQGTLIPNSQYISPNANDPKIQVPIDLYIDLIENGICDSPFYSFDYYSTNISPHNRDSLISLIRETTLHPPIIHIETPFSYSPTARIGYWTIYWEDYGTKKEEGSYLPIVYDIFDWDSTNQVEDPENPGAYILSPVKLNFSIYYKTGWWKYYNQQGVMIREERYDENGELKETSLYTPVPSPPSLSTTPRTGHWNFYWENGKKKEEGDFLQTTLDSSHWDSTKQVEDPNNPGTYIPDPLKPGSQIYCKTGWWKYYNEQGILIREERYDENGELVETKQIGK